ncbi:hypothetical protein PSTT_03929 [Puccinia striiformis]|uniref:Uncharacterized protein n=1 Tax=Puccinia striiformis TaxID=27350 RepID=A0A2S4VUL3_9BASI|nr:hypothetical protein PSTT_03929 [Puccinia striiformis]
MKSQCISSNEQIRHSSAKNLRPSVYKCCCWYPSSVSGVRKEGTESVGHLISSHLLPVGFGVGKPSRSGVVLLSMT